MRRTAAVVFVLLIVLTATAAGEDLYRVGVQSRTDADALRSAGVDPVVRLNRGYLVLADAAASAALNSSDLDVELLAQDVTRGQLAVDSRADRTNLDRFNLLYEEGGLRIFRINSRRDLQTAASEVPLAFSVEDFRPPIEYTPPQQLLRATAELEDLATLMNNVEQDSLFSYDSQLQAFYRRTAGTDSNHVARDWIAAKFASFGYDSVYLDPFYANVSVPNALCNNVVAVKIGDRLPGQQIVIGAHFDAVTVSPGADDNGSGTSAVLEMARILKDYQTDMTIVFVAFDAEEWGLYGSWHYADQAAARGDSIVYMLNQDMIGYYENTNEVKLYNGTDRSFSQTFQQIGDSLLGLQCHILGNAANSDHWPFTQHGYSATFYIEYQFSTVYHSVHDSTTYMDFDYMTKLVKAGLATAYTASQTAGVRPEIAFDFPSGRPKLVSPGVPMDIDVSLTGENGGSVEPGTATLVYSINGSEFTPSAMIHISGESYQATLPAIGCDDHLSYYFRVQAADAWGTFYDPQPTEPITAIAYSTLTTAFEDDFETDKGWVVIGDAADGQWQRGVPIDSGRGDPSSDYDGSGSCYLTDNDMKNSDVDSGMTVLISPAFALSGDEGLVQYARYWSDAFGGYEPDDAFDVFLSNNGGSDWVKVDQVGPYATTAEEGWHLHQVIVSDFLTPSNDMRLRFEVADTGQVTVVEAAVDAVTISDLTCVFAPDSDGDGVADYADNCPGTYNPLQEDANGDGIGDSCCCIGTVGDINCSGGIDITDLSVMIDHQFLTLTPLCCPMSANINYPGTGYPETDEIIDITDLQIMVDNQFLTLDPFPPCP